MIRGRCCSGADEDLQCQTHTARPPFMQSTPPMRFLLSATTTGDTFPVFPRIYGPWMMAAGAGVHWDVHTGTEWIVHVIHIGWPLLHVAEPYCTGLTFSCSYRYSYNCLNRHAVKLLQHCKSYIVHRQLVFTVQKGFWLDGNVYSHAYVHALFCLFCLKPIQKKLMSHSL